MSDGPRHVSDIITELCTDPEYPEDVRETLARATHPSKRCPCGECMRAYLKSVEGKGAA